MTKRDNNLHRLAADCQNTLPHKRFSPRHISYSPIYDALHLISAYDIIFQFVLHDILRTAVLRYLL